MTRHGITLALVVTIGLGLCATESVAQQTVTIRAGTMIDGRGATRTNVVLTVRGTKIEKIAPWVAGSAVTYDLSGYTLLPGLIDSHVHIDSNFGADGRAQNTGETPLVRLRAATDNAYATVAAGFTTVQSLGAASDSSLRALIEKGDAYGPRLLTSLRSFSDTTRTPEEVREKVIRRVKVGGQSPMDAITSITSRAATSLGLQDRIGAIAAGFEADLIAVEGNPAQDIEALRRVAFVMKGGAVVRGLQPKFEFLQSTLFSAGQSTLANAFADYDGDGDLDLFVGFNGTPNRLYRNEGGLFTEVAAAAGVADARATRAAGWGDFDGDGDPDLVIGFAPGAGAVLKLYRNDRGRFSDATVVAGIARDSAAVRQFSWIDLDADGDLDLFVALRDRPNAMYRNDAGRFTDIAPSLGLADTRRTVGAVWFDYDEDGDLDLYVANQDGDKNGLFRNDGGRFTDVADAAGVAWGGRAPNEATNGTVRPCTADVDGDGRLDLFNANYGKNGLFLNRGGGRFDDVSAAWGIAMDSRYDTCALEDFDNDGRIDLYVNGTVGGGVSYRDFLYRNTGRSFENVTPDKIANFASTHGAQWADIDGDGDVDLALNGSALGGMHAVMRNQLPAADAARSIAVRVLDANGRATRTGAEVRVYAAGTRRLLGTRIVDTGSGYDAQNDMPVRFGLPTRGTVDIEIIWPGGGSRVPVVRRGIDPAALKGGALEVRTLR